MKKSYLIYGAIAVILFFWAKGMYNGLVEQEEAVETAWSDVEVQYQRRMDVIPNLVSAAKAGAAHEIKAIEAVTNARAAMGSAKIEPEDLNEETLAEFEKKQGALSSAIGRLMMVVENYPQLTATEGFKDVRVALEGTENRIATARRNFNEVAKSYNTNIRRFPNTIFASIFGFDKKPYFRSAEGADQAVKVDFD